MAPSRAALLADLKLRGFGLSMDPPSPAAAAVRAEWHRWSTEPVLDRVAAVATFAQAHGFPCAFTETALET